MGVQITGNQKPRRNKPCVCGSELKWKQCHGDPLKKAICDDAVAKTMAELIYQEKVKRGLIESTEEKEEEPVIEIPNRIIQE